MFVALVICIAVLVCLGGIAKFGTGETDRERLERHLADQGGDLLRMEPVVEPGYPIGMHKIGRRGGYVYNISYLDGDDRCHFAECETSGALGVVLRRDGVREEAGET